MFTDWRSISLSPCCLIAGQTGTGLSDVVGFSRAEDDSSNIGLAKRPRLGIQSPNLVGNMDCLLGCCVKVVSWDTELQSGR